MNQEKLATSINLLKPEIKKLIKEKDWKQIKEVISELHSSDIAELFQELEVKYSLILLRLLPPQKQSEVFSELEGELQVEILNSLTDQDVKSIITELHPDDRTELFEELPPRLTRKLLNILPPEERREALQLLDYPENSVGRLMTPDYVALKKSWTVEEAIEHIRKYGKDAETINMLYVVDENWHLVDEIPIRRLILAERTQTIESLMDYHFISIAANSDQEEAIKLFEKYNLVALPVTDSESRLLGIITVDDIIDAIREEQTEDFTRFSAIKAKSIDLELFTRIKEIPFRKIFRARISWLFLLLIMDLVTGGIIQGFQETIAKYVVLVTFLPVLVDTAGNAGSQSATLVIRALALGTVKLKDWLFLLGRELLVALGLGLTMGLGISFMGFLRGGSLQVASVVVLAMVINVIVGCLVGVLLPFIFTRLKKDPATASTPLITTLADIMGTGIYLGIAYLMLG
ncbi:MAG TPA: magnesium transporter [Candidatus Omnitrophica bacterium]|nr:MAG: magnesium transporter [Candidatus Omnitrophota bacterium]RKY42915.1 MAG: magnesium transporter [Candidatus Omnitrophota bacterium]HEC69639.1 magnesium transporter [Candidatus Omnitrophota bacterium]